MCEASPNTKASDQHFLPPIAPTRRHSRHSPVPGRRHLSSVENSSWCDTARLDGIIPMPPAGSPSSSVRRSPPGLRYRGSYHQAHGADSSAPLSDSASPQCSPPTSARTRRPRGRSCQASGSQSPPSSALHTAAKNVIGDTKYGSEASTRDSSPTDDWRSSIGSCQTSPSMTFHSGRMASKSASESSSMAIDVVGEPSFLEPHKTASPKVPLSGLLLRRLLANQNATLTEDLTVHTGPVTVQAARPVTGPVTVQAARPVGVIKSLGAAKIFDLYHWEHVLQEDGDGGKVVVCRSKIATAGSSAEAGKELVMKICKKSYLQSRGVEEHFRSVQKKMLNFPKHDGVMPILEMLEDDTFYYTVMEKGEGGPLFQSLLDEFSDGVVPTPAIKKTLREVLQGLGHLHKHGVLHRDVKADNIVVHQGMAKFIDFDHADPDWDPAHPKRLNARFGTPRFSAPETFCGYFSQQSDLYSVGVLLYLLMTGNVPRDDDIFSEISNHGDGRHGGAAVYKNLKQHADVDWECDPWSKNPGCKDLCRSLLQFDPVSRPASAEDALTHEWFTDENTN